jgi:MoaA/NifB/PqqE/SkfB family radical SAM enzyme
MPVRTIAFHVTDRCQLNCQHCLRDPALKATDIDVAFVGRVLDEALTLFGPTEVSFTGGEPTLHPRFAELVDSAIARGNTWHFVSNGARFAKHVGLLATQPERIERLSYAAFSLDGATSETHDEIRGAGSFDDVMRAASTAVALDIPFQLRMTPNRQNAHEIEAFAFLAARLGATRVLYTGIQPTGTMHDRRLFLPFQDFRRIVDRVRSLNETLTIPVEVDDGFVNDDPVYMCAPFSSDTLHFDPYGNMNLCCRFSGTPCGDADAPVKWSVDDVGVQGGHLGMLAEATRTLAYRVQAQREASKDEWSRNACTACFKLHGAPHWSSTGANGPAADRERWRGAWAPSTPATE